MRIRTQLWLSALVIAGGAMLTAQAEVESAPRVCVTLQGNGERYPALLGQLLALLERGVEPSVVVGGSSAAPVAALVQAILHNPSVRNTEVTGPDGIPLSVPHKAARLLGASMGPVETLISLPALNRLGHTVRSMVAYRGAEMIANAFIGHPDQALANIEALVGQMTLLTEFFAESDFSAELLTDDFRQRQEQILNRWLTFGNFLRVTPTEFARALVTAPEDPRWTPTTEEIKVRFFELFRADPESGGPDPAKALAEHNGRLALAWPVMTRIPDSILTDTYLRTLSLARGMPFVAYTAIQGARPFWLPDGRRFWMAYKGGAEVPPGIVIHSTARLAVRNGHGGWVEQTGLESFFQVLYPASDLRDDVHRAWTRLGAERSFLEIPNPESPGKWLPVLEARQFLPLSERTLVEAFKASSAEPNALRRDPLPGVYPDTDAALLAYGGWFDHVALGLLGRLDACREARWLVEISTLSEGLRSFQVRAARPVLTGGISSVLRRLTGAHLSSDDPAQVWIDSLWESWRHARTLGPGENLHLDFDWDNASGLTGSEAEALNVAIDASRKAMFLVSYQYAAKKLESLPVPKVHPRFIYGRDLNAQQLRTVREPDALLQAVHEVLDQ